MNNMDENELFGISEQLNDTISRQAAIDAIDAIGHIATMPDGDKCF